MRLRPSARGGAAVLRLPRGGAWLVTAVHMRATEGAAATEADYESWWASLAFAAG